MWSPVLAESHRHWLHIDATRRRWVHHALTWLRQAICGLRGHSLLVQALHRTADLDARHVSITVEGGVATLIGSVTTWRQRETAEQAAASAPGIVRVQNEIGVEPNETTDEIC